MGDLSKDKRIRTDETDGLIVGRQNQIAQIQDQFEHVLNGGMGTYAITGRAGSGKTYLFTHCEPYFKNNNAIIIKHKFKQYSKDNFSLFSNITDKIFKRVLTLPKASFLLVQNQFNQELKNDMSALMRLSPLASHVFEHRAVSQSIKASKDETFQAFGHFLQISAKILFPLVVFIDDMQWADGTSSQFVGEICKERQINAYIIFSFRDSAENYDDLIAFCPNTISLGPLSDDDIRELIFKIYSDRINNFDYLIKLIQTLSGGNAFYISLIINQFIQNDMIVFSKKQKAWVVDSEKMRKLELTKYIEQMLEVKLHELENEDKHLLNIISCFGGRVSLDLLNRAVNLKNYNVNKLIEKLHLLAFVYKESSNYDENDVVVSFMHDIVFQTVYKFQSREQQLVMNYNILKAIFENSDPDFLLRNSDIITELLLNADLVMLEADNNDIWVKVLYKSANVAKDVQAFDYALSIFKLCEHLLNGRNYKNELDIQLDYMQCEFISEREDAAKQRYDLLCKRVFEPDKLLEIKLRFMYFYSYSANWEKVILQGKEIFKLLNFGFSKSFIAIDLIKSIFLYNNKRISEIRGAEIITDDRILTILEVLIIMFPAANRIDTNTFNLINFKLANLSMKYGNSQYAGIGYAAYSFILFFILKNPKKGDMLQKITIEMLDDENLSLQKSIAYALIGTFTYHWSNSFNDTLTFLNKSIEYGEKEVEYLYSNYAIVFSVITKYVSGSRLSELSDYISNCKIKKKRLENYLTRHMYNVYTSHISYLRFGEETYQAKLEQGKQAFFETIDLNAKMIKVHSLYLSNQFSEGFDLVNEIETLVWQHDGFVLNGDFNFYATLTRIEMDGKLLGKEKKLNLKMVKKRLKDLKYWSSVYEQTHMARYQLAITQYLNEIIGKSDDEGYYIAMSLSKESGNVQMEAFSNLIASNYYRNRNDKLTRFFANESALLYKEWGADYIADLICKRCGLINSVNGQNEERKEEIRNIDSDNHIAHIGRLGGMSQENAWQYFLENINLSYNAKYSCILFEKNGEMFGKYECRGGSNLSIYCEPVNMNHISGMPTNLIRYVARTEEEMVIDDSSGYEAFVPDATSHTNNVSHICIPIKQTNILVGVFYCRLENKNKFTSEIREDIISTLDFIASKEIIDYGQSQEDIISLTKREKEILDLVNKGMSNNQISEKAFISNGTVRNHLSNIYAKLGVENRMQAVVKAKALKII